MVFFCPKWWSIQNIKRTLTRIQTILINSNNETFCMNADRISRFDVVREMKIAPTTTFDTTHIKKTQPIFIVFIHVNVIGALFLLGRASLCVKFLVINLTLTKIYNNNESEKLSGLWLCAHVFAIVEKSLKTILAKMRNTPHHNGDHFPFLLTLIHANGGSIQFHRSQSKPIRCDPIK